MDEGPEPLQVVTAPLDVEVSHVISEERFDAALLGKRFQKPARVPRREKFVLAAVDD